MNLLGFGVTAGVGGKYALNTPVGSLGASVKSGNINTGRNSQSSLLLGQMITDKIPTEKIKKHSKNLQQVVGLR